MTLERCRVRRKRLGSRIFGWALMDDESDAGPPPVVAGGGSVTSESRRWSTAYIGRARRPWCRICPADSRPRLVMTLRGPGGDSHGAGHRRVGTRCRGPSNWSPNKSVWPWLDAIILVVDPSSERRSGTRPPRRFCSGPESQCSGGQQRLPTNVARCGPAFGGSVNRTASARY